MRILVTGGAGFIGHHLVRRAISRDHTVRIMDNLSTGFSDNLSGLEAEFIDASICDHEAVDRAVRHVDAVVHLAALGSVPRSIATPLVSHDVNVNGTLNILQSAVKNSVNHLVFASSSSVYGLNLASPKSERFWTRPLSPYAASKLAAEQYTLAYQQSFGLPTLAFRFFNVYGPGQRAGSAYAAVIPKFIDAALTGAPLEIYGDGSHSRDFTYVDSVVEVILDALARSVVVPEPVNLAFGTSVSLSGLVGEIEGLVGHRLPVDHLPERVGDVLHSSADPTRLTELFPAARATPLANGLRQTLEWHAERRATR